MVTPERETRVRARHPLELVGVPPAVRQVADRLTQAGAATYLVGGCVRDLLRGVPAADFDLATSAQPEAILGLFPRAIPIGLRHGTVMIPTSVGPVDVTSFRAGPHLEDDLAHRDFTINAMAYDPEAAELIDPFDGRADLAKRRLRAVSSAEDRLNEDPLRALRAARFVATLEVDVEPELERGMERVARRVVRVARERLRRELTTLLLAPGVAPALALLRRTGIEEVLAPGAAADAGRVVAALPVDLELRLAGWLRGANASSVLRRRHFSRRVVMQVERLLRLHPIEAEADSLADAAIRRLIKRAGEQNLAGLLALRRAELEAGESGADADAAADRLARLEAAIERVRCAGALALQRYELAIGGREVMNLLDCGPGPRVGRALAHLTDRVIEDPECNTPQALRELLATWVLRGS